MAPGANSKPGIGSWEKGRQVIGKDFLEIFTSNVEMSACRLDYIQNNARFGDYCLIEFLV